MYLEPETVIFWILGIVVVTWFLGVERGRKTEREEAARREKVHQDFWGMVDRLPDSDKTGILEEVVAEMEGNR